ncbi:MAG: transporter [Alphaproteobacteria bacterium]|nr:transporter [Alphaproteobacteria bacterium]|tara:strand:+ start:5302 stop:5985 length:684 start_codon:yes stop_codon:yes gene_type:complete
MPGLTTRFLVIAVLFVTCLLVSNITAVKLIEVQGYALTGAIVIFPISYIIGDVLTEVYGFAKARLVLWLGFAANLFAVLTFALVGVLPAAGFWDGQEAYDAILGATPRILAASFLAFLVGEFANSYVLARLKVITEGRMLWLRTIGSTIVGQSLDSIVFVFVAFWGILPTEILLGTIMVQAVAKIGYEILATPLTYAVVGWLKRSEGIDHYDRNTRFNPFAVTRLQD